MISLAVLGSTGSIGVQTLDIVREFPDDFHVVALGTGASVEVLASQVGEFNPDMVALADSTVASKLKELLPSGVELVSGPDACTHLATVADTVVNGIVGFDGLGVTLAALKAGKRLALANKESLIAAGPLVQQVRTTPGAELLPVDSEHCAIHQCLSAGGVSLDQPDSQKALLNQHRVQKLVLTASGGPFRGKSRSELANVSVEEALQHPTWSMGPKITVDSSTLMNKGLEVIEAHELFGVGYSQIEVVVHPQSVVHSMVEFKDGSTIAQLSLPDMRLCIGYAISYPGRLDKPYGKIDWSQIPSLEFELPDMEAFPCLELAFEAGRLGETAPAALNAANEVAVDAFLKGKISWIAISEVLGKALQQHQNIAASSVEAVLEADRVSRQNAVQIIEKL